MPALNRHPSTAQSSASSSSFSTALSDGDQSHLESLLFNVTAVFLALGSLIVAVLHYWHQRRKKKSKGEGTQSEGATQASRNSPRDVQIELARPLAPELSAETLEQAEVTERSDIDVSRRWDETQSQLETSQEHEHAESHEYNTVDEAGQAGVSCVGHPSGTHIARDRSDEKVEVRSHIDEEQTTCAGGLKETEDGE